MIYLTFGFCGETKRKKIPKLNRHYYYIQYLKANCEHGNGKRYISKIDKNNMYEITDN